MAFLLQGSVANLFFDFLISHPNHFVRFQVGQFQIYLIIDNLFFFVAVDDAIDGSLQHEIGTQFQSPFFSCLRRSIPWFCSSRSVRNSCRFSPACTSRTLPFLMIAFSMSLMKVSELMCSWLLLVTVPTTTTGRLLLCWLS